MALKFWIHVPFFYPDMDRPYHELIDEVVDIAQAAEELGFEGIVIPENNFHNYIVNPSSLQFIGLLAGRTSTLKIQSGVLVLPNYNPLLLAGAVALADHMTKGRLSVGVARGGGPYIAQRLGFDGSKSKEMYEESLDILVKAWMGVDISSDGQFWSFPETTVLPRPYQDPYPELWVAAQTESGIRSVASKGLNLLTSPNYGSFAPHGDLEQAIGFYDDEIAKTGQTRGQVLVMRRTWIDETDELAERHIDEIYHHWSHYASGAQGRPDVAGENRFRARDEGGDTGWARSQRVIKGGRMVPNPIDIPLDRIFERYDDPIVCGPERALSRYRHYEEIGVDKVGCLMAMGAPVDEIIHSMEVMAKHVLPHFQAAPQRVGGGVA